MCLFKHLKANFSSCVKKLRKITLNRKNIPPQFSQIFAILFFIVEILSKPCPNLKLQNFTYLPIFFTGFFYSLEIILEEVQK